MLDKQSKLVIDYLISIADDYGSIDKCKDIHLGIPNYSVRAVYDSIGYLNHIGYINVSYAWGGAPIQIDIQYLGLHYKDFERVKLKNFIYEGFLTPIVISFITTLLTLWIKLL